MKLYFEKIEPGSGESFRVAEYRGESFACPFHYHPEVEITLIVSSAGRRFVGDHIGRFGAGDLVLIGSEVPHMYFSDEYGAGDETVEAHSMVVQFRPDLWGDAFWTAPEMREARVLMSDARRGIRYFGETVERAAALMGEMGEGSGGVRMEKLIQLWGVLARSTERELLSSEGYTRPRGVGGLDQRIDKAYALVNERFRERLTQEEVAKQLGMSPSGFSRFFRESAGKTFKRFLSEVRIGQACQRLQVSDDRILEICYECGFSNLSNFNRRFLEHTGVTPKAYRRMYPHRGDESIRVPVSFERG